jgi:hypothetical protein
MVDTPKTDSTPTAPIQRSRFWEARMKGTVVSSVTPEENCGPLISACYLIVRCVLASALMLTMNLPSSNGHDAMHPELNPWFAKLRSKSGPCCDGSDALHLRDVEWTTQNKKESHYRVMVPKTADLYRSASNGQDMKKGDTEWVDVPDDALVTEPNLDHSTLVWVWYSSGFQMTDQPHIRCFMPGALT